MRYQSVHQALDDVLFLVASYVPLMHQRIIGTLENIKSQSLLDKQSAAMLTQHGQAFARFCHDFPLDNANATIRSRDTDEILVGTPASSIRSPLVWIIGMSSLGISVALNITHPQFISVGAQSISLLLSFGIVIVGHRSYSRGLSLQRATEKQASRTAGLLQVRREQVADTTRNLETLHTALVTHSQQLSGIPQARNFFDGLVMVARTTKGLSTSHRVSDMSTTAPLYDVSAALTKRTQTSYQPVANKRGLHFTADIPKGLAFHISPLDLRQLVDILVENAFTYTEAGTVIQLKGRRHGNQVLLTVYDQGPGIPESVLTHVFQPIQQQPTAQSEHPAEGSGKVSLGLQLCKLIMARIGGELRIKTKPGKGTVALVRAPRHQTDMTLYIPRTISKSSGQLQ